eukprot:TRINITY_DN24052_c0_g1_i1.p1 TRINITY_DN24052_c0_g1~~TRINITY_DN24052_c0_g1_i1.p1  ORF type:complete len:514 (+),score=219.37 TRINITY_DN24052_c0_g1_i1:86-1543(+)
MAEPAAADAAAPKKPVLRRVRFQDPKKVERLAAFDEEEGSLPGLGPVAAAPAAAPSLPSTIALIRRIKEQTRKTLEQQQARPDFTTEHQKDEEEEPEERDRSYLSVEQDKNVFVHKWKDIVVAFANDPDRLEYVCPAGLNGYDRKMLHQLAEQYNLGHQSYGVGAERHLILKKDGINRKHGKTLPPKRRISELTEWADMRHHFDPPSMRIDPAAAAAVQNAEREYQPESLDVIFRRNAEEQRERAETMSVRQRVMHLRVLLDQGFISDPIHTGLDDAPPQQPPQRAEPPAKRPRTDSGETQAERAMREFIENGLAPVQVTVERQSPDDPVGLVLSKRLLVQEVRGISENCGVPKDMFVNEVDGKDVKTPGDFTKAVQGKAQFTLTLWFMRKDGFTVPRLESIARQAEKALQKVVNAQDAEKKARAPIPAPGRMIEEMKCLTCDTSNPLGDVEPWEGQAPRFCPGCGRVTQWAVDRYEAEPDSDAD